MKKKNRNIYEKADNYTDKESFDELENELEVFIKFYKKEWTRTKRRIRKELLNIKNIRKHIINFFNFPISNVILSSLNITIPPPKIIHLMFCQVRDIWRGII